MNKKFMILGAALTAAGGLAVLAIYLHFLRPVESRAPTVKEMEQRAAHYGIVLPPSAPVPVKAAPPIDPKKPVRLAIGWLGLPDQAQNEQVADLMLAGLSAAGNLQLVDRQSLEKVLQESQLSLSGLVHAGTATRVGKLLRADWFLPGSAATVNGSNFLVVRLVDARSGVMLNADLFSRQEGVSPLVSKLSAFVRQSREAASHPAQPRVFLAIGGFKDVSVNDRQVGFPAKLRGYLTTAYQGNPDVTLLEREFVDLLQQEMRLDLAGLTDEAATNAPQPMQAAFWLVDGDFQSYEVSGYEVEVALRVHRMFGLSITDVLHGPPEEPLYREAKSKIDQAMTQQAGLLAAPTHRSEIQAQLQHGRELSPGTPPARYGAFLPKPTWGMDRDYKQTLGNLEEAIRAFQSVLILEPENHEAKLGLALCLQHVLIGKEPEARNLVREVAESSIDDGSKFYAMQYMAQYLRSEDPAGSEEWLRRAAEYQKAHMAICNGLGLIVLGPSPKTLATPAAAAAPAGKPLDPESKLVEDTRAMENQFSQKGPSTDSGSGYGIEAFVRGFGTNRTAAVDRLNELLPGLLEKFPRLAPDLIAIALTYQPDTNSPIVAKFVESFEHCAEHPDELLVKPNYFWRVSRSCYNWCMQNKLYALAARMVEVKRRVQMTKGRIEGGFGFFTSGVGSIGPTVQNPAPIELEDKTRLVYACMALEHWQDALDLLKGLPGQPYAVVGAFPWGNDINPIDWVAKCREKLNLPVEKDPRIFQLGDSQWTFETPGLFTTDQDSLWMAVGPKLWKAPLNAKTNMEIKLPKQPDSRITALCSGPDKVWIGTLGGGMIGSDGLIEYDKQSRTARRFTTKDGLLLDNISALYLHDETLWIGFGGFVGEGGLGRLDLQSGKITGLTPSLRSDSLKNSPTTWLGTRGLTAGRPGELLVFLSSNGQVTRPTLYRLQIASNTWESLPWNPDCVVSDSQRLVLSLREHFNPDPSLQGVGMVVQDFADGHLEKIGLSSGLPPQQVTTVTLNGDDLWVGGQGFIGVMDVQKRVLRKLCYTRLQTVSHIEIAGGDAWVLMDRLLYRIPLSDTR